MGGKICEKRAEMMKSISKTPCQRTEKMVYLLVACKKPKKKMFGVLEKEIGAFSKRKYINWENNKRNEEGMVF